jgi:hypothetical protein
MLKIIRAAKIISLWAIQIIIRDNLHFLAPCDIWWQCPDVPRPPPPPQRMSRLN